MSKGRQRLKRIWLNVHLFGIYNHPCILPVLSAVKYISLNWTKSIHLEWNIWSKRFSESLCISWLISQCAVQQQRRRVILLFVFVFSYLCIYVIVSLCIFISWSFSQYRVILLKAEKEGWQREKNQSRATELGLSCSTLICTSYLYCNCLVSVLYLCCICVAEQRNRDGGRSVSQH